MIEHSLLGASGSKRWLACQASYVVHKHLTESQILQDKTSTYARQGSAAHDLAARCLEDDLEPFEFFGQKIGGFEVGDSRDGIDMNAISTYVDYCSSLIQIGGMKLIEKSLGFPKIHRLLFGTVDFAFYKPKVGLWIVDYKNGAGIAVSPENNSQLMYYAYLAYLDFPAMSQEDEALPVTLGIVQPRCGGEPIKTYVTALKEIVKFGEKILLPRMQYLTDNETAADPEHVPGEHCQFCPVMLHCKKVRSDYKGLSVEASQFDVSDDELSELYEKRANVKRFLSALELEVRDRLMGGKAIASAKLIKSSNSYTGYSVVSSYDKRPNVDLTSNADAFAAFDVLQIESDKGKNHEF